MALHWSFFFFTFSETDKIVFIASIVERPFLQPKRVSESNLSASSRLSISASKNFCTEFNSGLVVSSCRLFLGFSIGTNLASFHSVGELTQPKLT